MKNTLLDITKLPEIAEEIAQLLHQAFMPSQSHTLASQIHLTYGSIFTKSNLYTSGGLYTALVCCLTSYYTQTDLTIKIDTYIKKINPISTKNLYECQEDLQWILQGLTDIIPLDTHLL